MFNYVVKAFETLACSVLIDQSKTTAHICARHQIARITAMQKYTKEVDVITLLGLIWHVNFLDQNSTT